MPGRSSAPARLPRLLQAAVDERVQPRAGPHDAARRSRAGRPPARRRCTHRVGAHAGGVDRHEPGGLAGVDHHPRLGPRGAGRRHQRRPVLQRPDVRLAVHHAPPGRCRRAPPRASARGVDAALRRRPPPGRGAPPSRAAVRQAASVAGCSTRAGHDVAAERAVGPPAGPATARLRASVAPEVKMIHSGSAPTSAATCSRARSSASAGAAPPLVQARRAAERARPGRAASPRAPAGRGRDAAGVVEVGGRARSPALGQPVGEQRAAGRPPGSRSGRAATS